MSQCEEAIDESEYFYINKPMENTMDLIFHTALESSPPCKGLIFRCEHTSWMGSKDDVNFRERYHLLKRKSCPGCDKCGWMIDDLNEMLIDSHMVGGVIHKGKHDQLYQLVTTNVSTDWETGYVDGYDFKFQEYVELDKNDKT